jgi:hypothetical protein
MGILLPIGGVIAAALIAVACVQVLNRLTSSNRESAKLANASVFILAFFASIVIDLIAFWYWLTLVPIVE